MEASAFQPQTQPDGAEVGEAIQSQVFIHTDASQTNSGESSRAQTLHLLLCRGSQPTATLEPANYEGVTREGSSCWPARRLAHLESGVWEERVRESPAQAVRDQGREGQGAGLP